MARIADVSLSLPATTQAASLTADNQLITVATGVDLVLITSDNTTAANRTFTLSNPVSDGQVLRLMLISGASTTAQLADSGNVALSAAWEPVQYGVLTLIGYSTGTTWVETARAAN